MAQQLTGNGDAAQILADLYKRHLFIHRRPGAEPVYWYHALFRRFLQDFARSTLDEERLFASQSRAARLMDANGQHDEAFQIFCETRDWDNAHRLVERHAQSLLAKGRGQTLREWITALPSETRVQAPWLGYWLGVSLIPLDQKAARQPLEHSYMQFKAQQDVLGQALAAAAMIETYLFEWYEFAPMRHWVETLEPVLRRHAVLVAQQAEYRIYPSLLVGMLYAAPEHSLLPHVVTRVTEMMDEDMDPNSKAAAAINLLSYCNITCDMTRARIAAFCMEGLLTAPELTPFNRLWCLVRLGYYYSLTGLYSKSQSALSEAADVGESNGLRGMRRTFLLIACYQINAHLMADDLRGGRLWYQRVKAMADLSRPVDAFTVAYSRRLLECAEESFSGIVDGAPRDMELAARTGMIYMEILRLEQEAQGAAILGLYPRMHDALTRLRRRIAGTCFFALYECLAQCVEIYALMAQGDSAGAHSMLPATLARARDTEFPFPQMARFSVIPGVVLEEALRAGVETVYARDTILRLHIKPPPGAGQFWPWPVRIYSLGSFEIQCGERRIEFSGRSPRRVLAVLQLIVAGGGEPVPLAHLMDALWPGDEADAARKALDVALVRLRRLLERTDAVIVREERATLNRTLCWVDAWAFAAEAGRMENSGRSPEDTLYAGLAALRLYRGPFLPSGVEEQHVMVARLRLRERLGRMVAYLGCALENSGQWEAALDCYRRGIDADELAEEFYLGAARCHAAAGRLAEAMSVLRRLRQTLSVVVGIDLSPKSEQLLRSLGGK